jgi:uncharacterized protein (TIGR03000 family)
VTASNSISPVQARSVGGTATGTSSTAGGSNALTPAEVKLLRDFLRSKVSTPEKTEKPRVPPQETERTASVPANVARITVKLPSDARLWVDQVECPLTSAVRSFNTLPLQPGQRYAYTLRMQVQRDGLTIGESRRVEIAAGRQVEVDFNQALTNTAQR